MSLNPEVRRGAVPDHSEEEVLVELYGPENDGWYSSRILDWIGLCDDLRDPDTRGYLVLRALVYEKYKKPIRNLTLSLLCELIPGPNGKASSQGRVRGILKALSDVGLVSTPEGGPLKTSSRASAAGKPLRIRINDMPHEGYSGWRNAEAKLKWLQAGRPPVGAGQNSDPVSEAGDSESEAGQNSNPAGQNSDPRGSNSDPHSGSDLRKREHPLVPSVGASDALAGRSPGDARRASSGSSACAREGGSAASGKTSPSLTPKTDSRGSARDPKSGSKKAAHTREQLDVVRRVRALFPPELLESGLPDLPVLSSAILTAMGEGRTVEQMGERIWFRWSNHGFADIWAEDGRFETPVGVAAALVRPLRRGDRFACPDLRCENGADVDTKVPCRLCAERIADWRAERARARGQGRPETPNASHSTSGPPDAPLPPQRAVQPRALLKDCGNNFCSASIPATAGPLCWDCVDEAETQQALENVGTSAPF